MCCKIAGGSLNKLKQLLLQVIKNICLRLKLYQKNELI